MAKNLRDIQIARIRDLLDLVSGSADDVRTSEQAFHRAGQFEKLATQT